MRRYLLLLFLVGFCAFSWFFSIKSYTSGAKEYETLMVNAKISFDKKMYEDAADKYKKAFQKNPKSTDALMGLANTYFLMEKYEDAAETCEKVLAVTPNNVEVVVLEAKSLISGGNYSKSLELLSKVEQTKQINDMVLDIKSKYALKYFKVNFPKNWDVSAPLTLHLSTLTENENMAAYNSKGKKIVHGELSYLGPVSEDGELYPAIQDGVWCYVDSNANRQLVSDREYEFLGPFCNGFAVAKRGNLFGYIDKDFNEYHFEFDNAYNFSNGKAVTCKNGHISIIGTNFNVVCDTEYSAAVVDEYGYTNHFGVSVFVKNNVCYLCNEDGEEIAGFSAESIGLPAENGAMVDFKKDGLYGFVDPKSGKVVIEAKYEDAKAFSKGLAPIKEGEKWGFIDEKENKIVKPTFSFATTVSESGSAWVKNEAGYALLSFYHLSK